MVNGGWFFGEKLRIEARGEVFNLFNRPNLITVQNDLSQPFLLVCSSLGCGLICGSTTVI